MSDNIKSEISFILNDVEIVEAIIKNDGKTTFAIYKDGVTKFKDQIILSDGQIVVPIKGSSDVIKHKFITLPSEPTSYSSEQDLFNEIKIFISKYFMTSSGFSEIMALYIMLTWVYERFEELPYLRVTGTLGTGKSRFLKVVAACAYHPITLGASSVAALFRTIDKFKGTFVLDEADSKNTDFSSEVAKILNNGNTKGMPIIRMRDNSKGDFTTDVFQVFGPKVIASRESLSDAAFESRCFSQKLYPNKNVKAPTSLNDDFHEESKILRSKLLMFRFKNYLTLTPKELKNTKVNNSRILQIAQPIWNIALLVNEDLAKNVIKEALLMDRDLTFNQADTQEADVLISIMKLLDLPEDKIHMKKIATKYNRLFGTGEYADESGESLLAFDSKINLSDRKVGEIVGKTLHLRKYKDNNGRYILKDRSTREILKNLCSRYGVTDDLIQ